MGNTASVENAAPMNLFEKLALIQNMVDVIQKTKEGHNYKYVPDTEILAKVTAGMKKHRVFLYPSIVHGSVEVVPYHTVKTKYDKTGKRLELNSDELIVKADMLFTWVNLDDMNDTLTVPWLLVGQQSDVSQASGSGLTYELRYFLLKFFKVATPEDDPDNYRRKQDEAGRQEEVELVKSTVEEINSLVSGRLNAMADESSRAEEREALTAIIKKHVKNEKGRPTGDYYKLKDPEAAAALLKELKERIGDTNA